MLKFKNKSILLDKDGFEITIQQALAKIRRLRKARARDPELFELNGGSLDLLLLYQHMEQAKKWNGKKNCQQFRALWQKHPYITLEGCPYFSKTERIDFYAKTENTR
jgi:hypothetical protein